MIRRFWLRIVVAIASFTIGFSLYALVSLSRLSLASEPTLPEPFPLGDRGEIVQPFCFPGTSIPLRTTADGRDFYFPYAPSSDERLSGTVELFTDYYTGVLGQMGETSLSVASDATVFETYRFLWIRTFHNPVVVRVEISDEGPHLVLKEWERRGLQRGVTVAKTRALSVE